MNSLKHVTALVLSCAAVLTVPALAQAGPVGGTYGPACGASETHGFRADHRAWMIGSVTNPACYVYVTITYTRGDKKVPYQQVDVTGWLASNTSARITTTYPTALASVTEFCVSVVIPAMRNIESHSCVKHSPLM